ncbi:MAG: ABC transporter permease subunit [Ktedonobacteraceae bacterium]|nr:ABC transporter permease subunit [Ktedonobacteraceae bacterium]
MSETPKLLEASPLARIQNNRTQRRNVRRSAISMLVASIPVIFIAIFVGIPALMAIAFSLGYTGGPNATVSLLDQNPQTAENGVTFSVYQQLVHDRSFVSDFWSTIWVTIVSVALILAVGWGLALYIRFARGRFASVISSLYLVPQFIPVVIASYAIVTFWSDNSYMSALVENTLHIHFTGFGHTLFGVVLGQLWVNIPFSVLLLASGLRNVPDSLIESARDVGASFPTILLRIILPLNVLPTIIVMTFTGIGVLGSFTIPYFTGPNSPTLLGVAMANYFQAFNAPQQASAMAVLVFVLAAGLGAFYVWANVRSNRKAGATQ